MPNTYTLLLLLLLLITEEEDVVAVAAAAGGGAWYIEKIVLCKMLNFYVCFEYPGKTVSTKPTSSYGSVDQNSHIYTSLKSIRII